jgi:hypothetical protein
LVLLLEKASLMVGFPLLLIPLAICNIIVFLMPGLSFAAPLFTVPLISGVGWSVTLSDLLLTLAILMLLFEVIKGARPGAKYLTDHLLSLIVFGGAAAEFVMLPQFGTSTYFLLTALALVDFLSGITLRSRRSRVATVAAPSSPVERRRDEPAPSLGPVPVPPPVSAVASSAPSIPSAEPIVEPSPIEPHIAHAEAVVEEPLEEAPAESPHEPSPEIHSPDIQPDGVMNPTRDNPQH